MCHKLRAAGLSTPVTSAPEAPASLVHGSLVPQATGLLFLVPCKTRPLLSVFISSSTVGEWVSRGIQRPREPLHLCDLQRGLCR